MADDRRGFGREMFPTNGAEQKTSPPPDNEGREFPFPHFPPPNSSNLNETLNAYSKNRDGDHTHTKRSRSQSRSRSSSISNLLLVATQRLGQETNRANTLDARCTEVLAHLRTIVEERDQLRRTLAKVQEELGLYKHQLDVAQNEIFRAQKIVDDVDKARVEAEEQAAKDRTLARQLASERAVWVAREEGRSEGFKEGLRQGRRWAYEAARKRSHTGEYTDGSYEEVDGNTEASEPSPRRSSSSSRGHWSSSSRSVRSQPDAASYAPTLPIHAMTSSDPGPDASNAPSSQYDHPAPAHQQPPRPQSAQQHAAPRAQSAQQHPPRPQSAQQQPLRPQPPQDQLPRRQSTQQHPPRLEAAEQHPPRPQSPRDQRPRPPSTQQQPSRPQPPQDQLPRRQSTQQHPPRPESAQQHPPRPQSPQDQRPRPPSTQQQEPPRPQPPQAQSSRHESGQHHPPRPQSPQNQRPRPQSAQPLHPQPPQEQPPRHESAQYPARTPSARSSRPLPRMPAHSPEPIDIRRGPTRTPSPALSHRSVALPPDGIPTMGADSVISLPPPHELSRPVSIVADSEYTPGTNRAGGRRRTMSGVSAISTTFSQFDILSPPRAAEAPMSRSDQVAREWRVANADPPERPQGTTEESHSSENFSTRSSVPYSQPSRRTGPRRPREIVMPMPLSTAMDTDGGMAYTRPMASTSAAPLRDPYSTPAGPSSAPATAFTAAPPPHRSQDYVDETGSTRSRSALAWIKSRFNRTVSASTVPINIQIEPPSNPASNPSTDCTVNTILLTAETAGVETLPQQFVPELAGALAGVQQLQHGDGNVIVLPDNELPRGFVPLSPILPSLYSAPVPIPVPVPAGDSFAGGARPPAPSLTPSPQPPAYTPRDIYAARELPRPATAAGTTRARNSPHFEVEAAGSRARARGASIGSAMLSPAPLNRPISIFSET